ncbi:MAG: PaaI family thioesterase [Thermoleophilaceae bacterium]
MSIRADDTDLQGRSPASPFDVHVGTEWLDLGPDEARARILVEDHHKQPAGVVHGGVLATLAESICSVATYRAVAGDGMTIMGQSNATTFLRPISAGHVNAVARPRHRGRTTWIWDVEISDDDERVCALVRMTIAVRPARSNA